MKTNLILKIEKRRKKAKIFNLMQFFKKERFKKRKILN
jgi:hypothetical protein